MAFIYKIINLINDKSYIGKTQRDIDTRWKEHLRKYTKYENIPLYRAMRKYGIENFTIEKIEECENDIVNEREQYWIQFYNTYAHGYNGTLGGDGSLLEFPEEEVMEIITKYKNGERLDHLCKEYHHDYDTIKRIFKEKGISINTNAGPMKLAKRIYAVNPLTLEIEMEFPSISEAGRQLCEEGKSPVALAGQLSRAKNTKRISHGYLWRTEDFLPSERAIREELAK